MNLTNIIRKIITIIIISLFSLVLIQPVTLYAESRLTFDDCINIALKNNKQLKILQEKINAASAKKKEAFGSYWPQLSAAFNYTRLDKEPTMQLPAAFGGGTIAIGSEDSFLGRLSLQQPLYLGGKVRQGNVQADLGYNLALLDYKKFKDDLIFQVKQNFYGVILARQFVRISQEAYDVTASHLKTSQALYDEGKISNYDVSRVKVQLANNKTNLLRAQNALKIQQETLLTLIAFEAPESDTEAEIFGQLGYLEKPAKDFQTGLTQALAKRIEITQMDLQDKLNESLIQIYRAGLRPSIVASGNYDYQSTKWSAQSDDWDKKWAAYLTLSIPLFDGFSTRARVKQGYSQKEQIKLAKEQLIGGIKLEVRQAYYNFQQAQENIKGQQENIDTAKDNLRIAQERYKLGLMSDIEVRDAELTLTQAETNYFQALFDYITARENWEKVIGDTLE